MRLTKQLLKREKIGMMKRLKELQAMTDDQFRDEVTRINKQWNVQITGSDRELALWLARDLVDRALPDYWL